jgi:GntR family transcriptional regulator/MocR family aminotransferase
MKRAAKLQPLPVSVDRAAALPLWYQLSVRVRVLIADGRLRPGARLPSSRDLARQLHLSRNTVLAAYDELAGRNLLRGRTGLGSFVADGAHAQPPLRVWFQDPSGNLLALSSLA